MKQLIVTLNRRNLPSPAVINQIIIQGDTSLVLYPDILYAHPYAETSLTLDTQTDIGLIHALKAAFKKAPPHAIVVFNASTEADASAFLASIHQFFTHQPTFFHPNESKALHHAAQKLHLTETQKTLLKRAAVFAKWRRPNQLIALLSDLPEVTIKKERNARFHELIQRLMA